MTTNIPGSVHKRYNDDDRYPAYRASDGQIHSLIGRHWVHVVNPYIAETFRPQPAAAALLEALHSLSYPDPMPGIIAASIAAKWGIPSPPCGMTDVIPAAWVCHTLATKGVTAFALSLDLPTYHSGGDR